MKKIILALLAVGALSAIAYYVSKPAPSAADVPAVPATTASKPTPSVTMPTAKPIVPVAAPAPVSPPAVEIEPAAPIAASASQSPASQPGSSSPRAELSTTIPELARLINAQDFETLMRDFMPPDELTALLAMDGQPGQPIALADLAERMRQNPNFLQQMAGAAQFLNYLQAQTPTFDANGESASYPMPQPVNGQNAINFIKVGGYWYVKNGVQFFK